MSSNHKKKWTVKDIDELEVLIDAGKDMTYISKALGRTQYAIELKKMHLAHNEIKNKNKTIDFVVDKFNLKLNDFNKYIENNKDEKTKTDIQYNIMSYDEFVQKYKKYNTIMFFDTETTTNISYQARLVELGYYIIDLKTNKAIKKYNQIIKPENFMIPDDAINVHKITNEKAHNEGIDVNISLKDFKEDLKNVDIIMAHNLMYDVQVIFNECTINNHHNLKNLLLNKDKYCSLKLAKKKIAKENIKSYKLTDVYEKIFNKPTPEKHRAKYDAKVCGNCVIGIMS